MIKLVRVAKLLVLTGVMFFSGNSIAEDSMETATSYVENNVYKVNPGDIIEINVWKEEGMIQEVLVRPDGGISFPLVGDIQVAKLSFSEIEKVISEKLRHYLADPVVTVSAKQLLGNKVYVIGQVQKPGEFLVTQNATVMQILSMAGGMTPFADVNDIIILRKDASGKQQAIEFEYGELEDGDELQQNIMMQAGDVVVVP